MFYLKKLRKPAKNSGEKKKSKRKAVRGPNVAHKQANEPF